MAVTYRLFDAAERCERVAAEIYRVLSDRFSWHAQAHVLFRRLHEEELQHATRIRLLASQYRTQPRLLGSGVLGMPDPLAMLVHAEAMLEEVKRGAWGDDLVEVKRRLQELEEQGAATHAEVMAAGGAPGLAEFFQELAKQDKAHHALLAAL